MVSVSTSTDLVVWSLCWKWLVSFWEILLGFVRVCAADMSSLTILHLLTKYKISQILPSQFSDNHHLPQLKLTAQVELPAKKRKFYCL